MPVGDLVRQGRGFSRDGEDGTLLPDTETQVDERISLVPPYNLILLNDDDHTYEYVIHMLQKLFGYPPAKGYQMACEVDSTGRVIVLTTTLERAEFKQEQIHAFGPDKRLPRCKGSMSAIIEPAPGW